MLKRITRLTLLAGLAMQAAILAETALPLVNPGFEEGRDGWSGDNTMSQVAADAAHDGQFGLRVTDNDQNAGSSFRSSPMPVTANRSYALRFQARNTTKDGAVGVYLQFADSANKSLNAPGRHPEIILPVPSTNDWQPFTLVGKAPAEATTVTIWVHSFNGATGSTDLDTFSMAELTPEEEQTVISSSVALARNQRRFPSLNPQRIAEIAAMLPPTPAGFGKPIADRDAWQRLAQFPEAAGIIKSAEALVSTTPPELPDDLYLEFSRNGNRTNYQRPYGQRTSRINTLLRAECLENQGRFLPTLEQDIIAMCDERSWVMPAHDSSLVNFNREQLYSDLGCTARGKLLANVDWWLQEKLSPDVRQRLRQEITTRILDPYFKVIRTGDLAGHWWAMGDNNWNAVCTNNVVQIALSLLESVQERAEILAAMDVSNPIFLSGFTPDGYCSEGMGYWNYGFGHFMAMGEAVLAATNGQLSIYDDPIIENICAFARNAQIEEGLVPAFADCGINAKPSTGVLLLIQRRFPQSMFRRVTFASPLMMDGDTFALAGFGDENAFAEKVPEDASLPPRSYFNNAGILITRSSHPQYGSFGAAIKAGHNGEQHNHNDVGSFLVTMNQRAYILDPGAEVYTKRTFSKDRYVSQVLNSYGHPVPIVAGKLQRTGRKAAGTIRQEEFSDQLDRIVIDFKDAYDVPELTKLERSFAFNRQSGQVIVRDDVAFSSPQSFGTALVTYDRVHQRNDQHLVIYDGKGGLDVIITCEGGNATFAIEELDNPGRPSPKRLGFTMDQPVLQASIAFTIAPATSLLGLPGFYVAPDEAHFKPVIDQAISIEAENISEQLNGEVKIEVKPGASQQAFKLWDKKDHRLSWDFTVPSQGHYAVMVRCCHGFDDGVARHVLLDGKPLNENDNPFLFPGSGGWSSKDDQWRNAWLADRGVATLLELSPGTHRLTMINADDRGLNLDWIRIVPATP